MAGLAAAVGGAGAFNSAGAGAPTGSVRDARRGGALLATPLPRGLNASARSNTIVRPLYSSGASGSSARP